MVKKIQFLIIWLGLSLTVAGQETKSIPYKDCDALLNVMWEDPAAFSRNGEMQILIDNIESVSIIDLKRLFKKIFEDNDGLIINDSKSKEGYMGMLNRKSTNKRNKYFYHKMKSGFRDKGKYPDNKTILAEGDSWFQFPLFLKDIIDHLKKREDYAILSIAKGGEWLANILREYNYIKYYLNLKPDVMLMSGGGNDLVGLRLSSVVDLPVNNVLSDKYLKNYREHIISRLTSKRNLDANDSSEVVNLERSENTLHYDEQLVQTLMHGRTFLNARFYALLTFHRLQYYLFLESLRKTDPVHFQNTLKIIIQGYDYPIPSFKKGKHTGQFLINSFSEHGEWLKLPLMTKGITNEYDQKAVTAAVIFEFNEMLIDVISDPRYKDVSLYFIDSRGAVEQLSKLDKKFYWNDELHPSSSVFKKIAEAHMACIDGTQKKGVIKLTDFIKNK